MGKRRTNLPVLAGFRIVRATTELKSFTELALTALSLLMLLQRLFGGNSCIVGASVLVTYVKSDDGSRALVHEHSERLSNMGT